MISALELAKYSLKNSQKELSNLELQKTLYFTKLDFIKKFDKPEEEITLKTLTDKELEIIN